MLSSLLAIVARFWIMLSSLVLDAGTVRSSLVAFLFNYADDLQELVLSEFEPKSGFFVVRNAR